MLLTIHSISLGDWAAAYEKATALVAQLTNSEKLSSSTGGDVSLVNWIALEFKDGTQRVQGYDYVTGFRKRLRSSPHGTKT